MRSTGDHHKEMPDSMTVGEIFPDIEDKYQKNTVSHRSEEG